MRSRPGFPSTDDGLNVDLIMACRLGEWGRSMAWIHLVNAFDERDKNAGLVSWQYAPTDPHRPGEA